MYYKLYLSCLFIFVSFTGVSQNDSTQTRGTIKINKSKNTELYIEAYINFSDFELEKLNGNFSKRDVFQPFPIVEGHSFPFNYTKFFYDRFKNIKVDLRGKNSDTVYMEVYVSKKGKAFVKDITNSMVNGKKVFFDSGASIYMNELHQNCFTFLNEIKDWLPAYVLIQKRTKFKGQTVIKPVKKNIDSSQILTIIFSTEPFDY